ncbi:MAG: ThuA domain-containing protein [Prolixibacteraceae bacterium]|jgi:type 1 glutamine amidotransferase|nr:ThuA domain-containing protein [Prolixibacteraceae bacterium]
MAKQNNSINILVFSKTDGYRHESISAGLKALNEITIEQNWEMYATEDSTYFTTENLQKFDVLIFLSTIGNILNENQQKEIEQFVENGKSILTIHSGTITEDNWGWYQQAMQAKFVGHPPTQMGKMIVENNTHPTTKMFPSEGWEINEEWYSFDRNPRAKVIVLTSADESTYNVDDNGWFEGAKQRMGDHPLIWYRKMGKGVVYQSALGHTPEMYSNPIYRAHITACIQWLPKK